MNDLMRERLVATLGHKQPDSIPIDFGGTAVTGVHVSCVAALRDHYGLEKRLIRVVDPSQMLGLMDDDLREAMGIDVMGIFAEIPCSDFRQTNGRLAVRTAWSPGSQGLQHDSRCRKAIL